MTWCRLERADGVVIASRVAMATRFWHRFRGLMLRRRLDDGEGIALQPCSAIHMFFMRFSLDVLFLDERGQVLRIVEQLQPWRMTRAVRGARVTVELVAGTAAERGVQVGERLRLVPS